MRRGHEFTVYDRIPNIYIYVYINNTIIYISNAFKKFNTNVASN